MAQSSGATREVMPGSSSNAIPVNYTARPQLDQRVDGSDEDDSKRRRKEKKSKDKKKRKKHSHKHKHSRKHSHDLYSDESEDDRHYKNRLRDERGRSVHEHDRNADFASKSSSRNRKHDSRSRSPRRSNRSPRRYSGSPRRSSHTHSRHNRSISPAERADQHKKLSSSPSRRDVGSQSSMRRQEASSLSPDRRSRHRQYSRDSRRRRQSSYSRSPSRGRTMSRRDAWNIALWCDISTAFVRKSNHPTNPSYYVGLTFFNTCKLYVAIDTIIMQLLLKLNFIYSNVQFWDVGMKMH